MAMGAIGFLSPLILLGLLALPVLWWLLRAVPPAAIKRKFPAVTLLIGLHDPESTPDKTPWWLLVLRMITLAAIIIGFAGPILNPSETKTSRGPLLVLTDASWASAPDWSNRQERLSAILNDAGKQGRPVAVIALTAKRASGATHLQFQPARDWTEKLSGISPAPWEPNYSGFQAWLGKLSDQKFETIWVSDGLAREGRSNLATALSDHGHLSVIQSNGQILAVRTPKFHDGQIGVDVLRKTAGAPLSVSVLAFGPDPSGIERELGQSRATFGASDTSATADFTLPSELRNRIRRFSVATSRSAGAVVLSDDALKRRKVALFAGSRPREGQELVTSLHFLKKALAPTTDLIEAPMHDALLANPDVVILADVAHMSDSETKALIDWIDQGGLLIRFAGPRLASESLRQIDEDPLLPVQLRAGGRDVGGTMSWGTPKRLDPFQKGSVFFGLKIPDDVTVSTQVLAQPDPYLNERTIASLQDGTPLVTRKSLGDGSIVLFHVTANAEWSSLPLSGLFVEMLQRLAVSSRAGAMRPSDLLGQAWQPEKVMDAYGDLTSGEDRVAVAGEKLVKGKLGPDLLPGTYQNNDRQVALNVIRTERVLGAAVWPAFVKISPLASQSERPLKAEFLTLALLLMLLDTLATLWIGGRLSGPRVGTVAAVLLATMITPPQAHAGDDAKAIAATSNTVLAYVITGDARVDAMSEAGLFGLSRMLIQRTAIEPADPIAINLETDELAFFPIIYWPVTEAQPMPSPAAYDKLNAYLATGGMILFDTRDADIGRFGSDTPNGRKLKEIAARLDIPALEPIPQDHVLTRSFYLLQDFPGRYARSDVWVEAAPKGAVRDAGMPFRTLNDGVSPVVIGGNDWAAAWATSRHGTYLHQVGRGGSAGERQREIAFRFGVNLVMYVLTGNYKSDQVHVPALLERLGQ